MKAPVDQRLSALVRRAIDAGESDSLTRSELLAALVLHAPDDGEALHQIIRRYRKAQVRDAVVTDGEAPVADLVLLEERKPGRR